MDANAMACSLALSLACMSVRLLSTLAAADVGLRRTATGLANSPTPAAAAPYYCAPAAAKVDFANSKIVLDYSTIMIYSYRLVSHDRFFSLAFFSNLTLATLCSLLGAGRQKCFHGMRREGE